MADDERIQPALPDPEAPQMPTAPSVPQGLSLSKPDKGDPAEKDPPLRRTRKVKRSKPRKKISCLCCIGIACLLQMFVVATEVGIVFLVFRPKAPKYSVDSIRITQFNLSNDNSLSAKFDVTITARNPNKNMGIYYKGGSHISVWYTDTKLSEGALPKFYQGHRNITVLDVPLTGETKKARGLLSSLQQRQQTGIIPLNLRVNQPVKIKLRKVMLEKLVKMKFKVRCRLVVDRITADNAITIRDSSCKFSFSL